MSLLARIALPALALIGSAIAQNECGSSNTFTIQSTGDASRIAKCKTWRGDVDVSSELAQDVVLDGLESLDGDLTVKGNSALQQVTGSGLTNITGKLEINNVSQLSTLSFPMLTSIGSLVLEGLPNLRALNFTSQVTKCPKIDIQNTQLQDLNGVNVDKADTIFIANNDGIGNITMDVTNVTESLTLSFNNKDVAVSFPKLLQAKNATFRAVGSLNLPALSKVAPGSMGVYQSKLETLACPNLTTMGQDLTIAINEQLTNVSFPKLKTVGASLQIANNTALRKIDGFPELTDVSAALDFSGDLTEVKTPKINFVKGVFNLQSTNDLGNTCDFYNGIKNKLGPAPKYVCQGKLNEARTADGASSGSNGNNTKNAAFPLHVQPTYLGLAGLAAVLLV